MGTHSTNVWGFQGGKLKYWKGTRESWSAKGFFSECGGGRDRWTARELYGLEEEEELLQRNSPQTANLSLNLLSPPDLPRVDRRGLLRVQCWESTWLRTNSSPWNEAGPLKQWRASKLHIRNFECWNTLGTKNCDCWSCGRQLGHLDLLILWSPKKEKHWSWERCARDTYSSLYVPSSH